jgi:hypothetical protein
MSINEEERMIRRRVSSCKSRAKKKGIEFNLTPEYLMKLAENHCPITNIPMEFKTKYAWHDKSAPVLVRKDYDLGFIETNMAWVIKEVHLQRLGFLSANKKQRIKLEEMFGLTARLYC